MPLKKLTLRPGVNRENTRYTNENGWYESQWVRFRQGTPEKIGGYSPLLQRNINTVPYYGTQQLAPGVIDNIYTYTYSSGSDFVSVGTNRGVYVSRADRLPSGATSYWNQPIIDENSVVETTTVLSYILSGTGLNTMTVFLSGTPDLGGLFAGLRVKFTVSPSSWPDLSPPADYVYTVTGSSVPSQFTIQLNNSSGAPTPIPFVCTAGVLFRTFPDVSNYSKWSQAAFGTSLILTQGSPIWVYVPTPGTAPVGDKAVSLLDLPGTTAPPASASFVLVSDVSRFVMAFNAQNYAKTASAMVVRWSDQESYLDWEPTATNQAGELQLSRGSVIVTAIQARQEILVWTDIALYSMQYVGAPIVWSAQLVGENISIVSQNAVAYSNGVAYWMGDGKFYVYKGTVETLNCDLRKYIFDDIDTQFYSEVFAGTSESFNEVWWYYISKDADSTAQCNKYVVYNYAENIWYYGEDSACAWLDRRVLDSSQEASTGPIKAIAYEADPVGDPGVYKSVMYQTEYKNDAYEFIVGLSVTAARVAIPAYITSAEFDLDDGHQFMFVWRMLPDITFAGSDIASPSVEFALLPMKNSGSGVTNPPSVGGDNDAVVTSIGLEPTYTIEEFTGQVFTRIRARQIMIKVSSDGVGVAWQVGSPRLDMRPDGRR